MAIGINWKEVWADVWAPVWAQEVQPLNLELDAGSLTIEGQQITFTLGVALDAGSVTVAGQTVAFETDVALQAGSLTLAGQEVDFLLGGDIDMSLEAGSLTLTGGTLDFALSGQNAGGAYWPTTKAKKRKRGKDRADELREEAAELRAQIERAIRCEPVTVPPPAEIVAPVAPVEAPRPTLRAPVLVNLSAEVLALRVELANAVRAQHEAQVEAHISRLEADIERAAFAAADAIERALERRLKKLTKAH